MNDYLDALDRQSEKDRRLNRFDPLVHQSGAIDRDLFSHLPCRMLERLSHRDLRKISFVLVEWAAGSGQDQALHFTAG